MGYVKGSRVSRSRHDTIHYGENKPVAALVVRNYVANVDRPLGRLIKMLCLPGEKSTGALCKECESPCEFGMEYLRRKDSP